MSLTSHQIKAQIYADAMMSPGWISVTRQFGWTRAQLLARGLSAARTADADARRVLGLPDDASIPPVARIGDCSPSLTPSVPHVRSSI